MGFNEDGKTFAGMGVDFADYDNDGRPDVVVTDLSNERYRALPPERRRQLPGRHQQLRRGRAPPSPSPGWSTGFFDYDNDGWKDIFVAQGHVMDTIEKTAPNLRYLQPPLLLRNESGRFVRVSPGDVFQGEWAGRGAAFGDLDNDGDVDVVVSNVGQRALVLRNDGGTARLAGDPDGGHDLEPRRPRVPREGRVRVGPTQYFTVTTAVGYLSASDKRLLVGLGGDARRELVEIRWPSGIVQTIRERRGRPVARGDGARAMITRRDGARRCSRAPSRLRLQRLRAGHLLARRQAAAARQAFRPPVPRALHRRRGRRPASRSRSSTAASTRKSYIIEVVGCGVAFLDYDNDGWLDLLRPERHPARGRAARAPPTASTRTTATARSPT